MGLFRHYWILAKFLQTAFVAVVLLLQMPLITYVVGVAAETALSGTEFRGARISLVLPHAAGGLLLLLVAAVLSVYKPRGLTRYGWRRRHEKSGAGRWQMPAGDPR